MKLSNRVRDAMTPGAPAGSPGVPLLFCRTSADMLGDRCIHPLLPEMKTIPLRARRVLHLLTLTTALLAAAAPVEAQERARDLGINLPGTPGTLNAITDVAGVEVGHATIIRGEGRLVRGQGPVRTGVTAILPRGRTGPD